MIRKTVWAINFCLMGMMGYVYGYHDGVTAEQTRVDPMAVNYAVLQAMLNDGK
jgi:hypothetical protein